MFWEGFLCEFNVIRPYEPWEGIKIKLEKFRSVFEFFQNCFGLAIQGEVFWFNFVFSCYKYIPTPKTSCTTSLKTCLGAVWLDIFSYLSRWWVLSQYFLSLTYYCLFLAISPSRHLFSSIFFSLILISEEIFFLLLLIFLFTYLSIPYSSIFSFHLFLYIYSSLTFLCYRKFPATLIFKLFLIQPYIHQFRPYITSPY